MQPQQTADKVYSTHDAAASKHQPSTLQLPRPTPLMSPPGTQGGHVLNPACQHTNPTANTHTTPAHTPVLHVNCAPIHPSQPTVLETDSPAPITQNQTCPDPAEGLIPQSCRAAAGRTNHTRHMPRGTEPAMTTAAPPPYSRRRLVHCCAALSCCAGGHITPCTAVLAGTSLLGA